MGRKNKTYSLDEGTIDWLRDEAARRSLGKRKGEPKVTASSIIDELAAWAMSPPNGEPIPRGEKR